MRVSLFIITIPLLIFCSEAPSDNKKSDANFISEISPFLSGETIGTKQPKEFKAADTNSINFEGKNILSHGKVKEVLFYLHSTKVNKDFELLTNWYNELLNDSLNNHSYNSWRSDSIEYLLFKQSDSTIFANIYLYN